MLGTFNLIVPLLSSVCLSIAVNRCLLWLLFNELQFSGIWEIPLQYLQSHLRLIYFYMLIAGTYRLLLPFLALLRQIRLA